MKKLLIISLLFAYSAMQAQERAITLEDIWQKYSFYPKSVQGFQFMKNGKHYVEQTAKGELLELDFGTGARVGNLLEGFSGTDFDAYTLSEDEQKILLSSETEGLYRHSFYAKYIVFDRQTKKITDIAPNGEKIRLATFNSKGDKVAYILANNIWYKDLSTGKNIQVTTDGKANEIINGAPDWVYEEEFSMSTAFQWSPDGTKIGYTKFEEKNVKEVMLTLYENGLYPKYESFKYPKAGEENSTVSVYIFDVESQKTQMVEGIKGNDFYVPRTRWTLDGKDFCVWKMNRHQNDLQMLLADAKTGKTRLMMQEKNETYLDIAPGIDVTDNFKFLKDGKHFTWLSERDGWNHLYICDEKGSCEQLTKGNWEVTTVYGVDEARGKIYYQSTEESPLERHIYSIDLKGKNKKRLDNAKGWNEATFNPTYDFFTLSNSTINTPTTYAVFDNMGKKIKDLEDNAALRKKGQEYNTAKVEFFEFKTSENVSLNGWMVKPKKMEAGKKYPVLMYQYGGPNSQEVADKWEDFNYWWFQMLAQQGYVVACVDGRGTGGRGEAFKKSTYKDLGNLENKDQIEAARWLGKQAYIDASRIGIFGWSYGGYQSLLAILKGSDVFKAAIAVAPVTNWKWYDSVYTERFLTTPKENEKGYESNSPINFAGQLKGNLLLIHGDADDNVHYQNSAEMAAALIKANKQFDTYVYPNKNHGIYGGNTRLHLYTKMTNFLKEKL